MILFNSAGSRNLANLLRAPGWLTEPYNIQLSGLAGELVEPILRDGGGVPAGGGPALFLLLCTAGQSRLNLSLNSKVMFSEQRSSIDHIV